MASLKMLLHLFLAMPQKPDAKPGTDAMRQLTESVKIDRQKNRAIITASVPLDLAKKLLSPETP